MVIVIYYKRVDHMGSGKVKKESNGRAMPGRPIFEKLISHYNVVCPDVLETRNLASDYRKIRPNKWPKWMHYEFLDRWQDGKIAIEIHIEKRDNKNLEKMLLEMIL